MGNEIKMSHHVTTINDFILAIERWVGQDKGH